jgi:hypothetical protein
MGHETISSESVRAGSEMARMANSGRSRWFWADEITLPGRMVTA